MSPCNAVMRLVTNFSGLLGERNMIISPRRRELGRLRSYFCTKAISSLVVEVPGLKVGDMDEPEM